MAVYLKNVDLLNEVIKSKQNGEPTPELINMFILMVDKISTKYSYQDESLRNDTKQNALICLLENWKKFDEAKYTNAFAYFTQIIKNGIHIFFTTWSGSRKVAREGVKTISLDYCNGDGIKFYGL